MSTLGIGVRVYVGWAPSDWCHRGADAARCRTGTIADGPLRPGEVIYEMNDGSLATSRHVLWTVNIDGFGLINAEESLLTPIDDDHHTEDREQEAPVDAVSA